MAYRHFRNVGFALFVALSGCGESSESPEAANPSHPMPVDRLTYQQKFKAFKTQLKYHGPSPQPWDEQELPENTSQIFYPSGDLSLKAWVYRPPSAENERHPVMVYFHGGFAFAAEDFQDCQPFIDAGYIVMCPMLRGENGNPGRFELMLGEVEDAKAAVQWVADQSYVDSDRVYAFGHSAGGGIAALLSLRDDVPVRHSGSCGGFYGAGTFERWADFVPFDWSDSREVEMRTLIGHFQDMRFHHYAYLGTQEYLDDERLAVLEDINGGGSRFTAIRIPGDHFTSLRPAMDRYLELIRNDEY